MGSVPWWSKENSQSTLGTSGRFESTVPRLIASCRPRISLTITARCDHGQGGDQISRYRLASISNSPISVPNGVENAYFCLLNDPSALISLFFDIVINPFFIIIL